MSRDSLPPLEDEFTRALLGSADADGPTPAAYAKVAGTLGVGVGVGVNIGASIPATAAVAAAGVAGVGRWSTSLGAKLFFGFSGALLVGGASALLVRGPESVEPVPSAVVHVPAVTRTMGESLPVASDRPAQAEAGSVAPGVASAAANPAAVRSVGQGHGAAVLAQRPFTGAPAARRASHAAAPSRTPAAGSTDSSLAAQVQSLDRARVALAGGDASSALAEIARYRSAWPSGFFLTEASVLEIEALAASGQRSRARARAADFVAAHPDSPQADRLRALSPRKKP